MSPGLPVKLRKLLVVEDDLLSQAVILSTLSGLEPLPKVVTATTVAEAIAALKVHEFDAAMVDWRLPDGLGGNVLDFAVQQLDAGPRDAVALVFERLSNQHVP